VAPCGFQGGCWFQGGCPAGFRAGDLNPEFQEKIYRNFTIKIFLVKIYLKKYFVILYI
jgi:hypothetical protein